MKYRALNTLPHLPINKYILFRMGYYISSLGISVHMESTTQKFQFSLTLPCLWLQLIWFCNPGAHHIMIFNSL